MRKLRPIQPGEVGSPAPREPGFKEYHPERDPLGILGSSEGEGVTHDSEPIYPADQPVGIPMLKPQGKGQRPLGWMAGADTGGAGPGSLSCS